MGGTEKPDWAGDLMRRWSAGRGSPPGPGPEPGQRLEAILAAARSAFAFLGQNTGADLTDRNKYQAMFSIMDRILEFESFSLAEYTYDLGRSAPGVRLWLEGGEGERVVRVILFPDVRQWRVDWEGRKISRLLLSLALAPEGITPAPGPGEAGLFPDGADWPEALFLALGLPLAPEILPQ